MITFENCLLWCLLRAQPTAVRQCHNKGLPECWISVLLPAIGVRNMLKSKQWTELLKLSFAGMHGSLSYAKFLVCQCTSKYKQRSTVQPWEWLWNWKDASSVVSFAMGMLLCCSCCQPYYLTHPCCSESLVFSSFRPTR